MIGKGETPSKLFLSLLFTFTILKNINPLQYVGQYRHKVHRGMY